MKNFLGYIANKIVQSTPRSKKVGPTIKSVKTNLKKTVKEIKGERFTKNIKALDKAQGKLKTGKQMMREGQKERKKVLVKLFVAKGAK